ncbi:MAG: hypothetical protein H6983_08465 [Ectothiorhodospiraceae bacterium]|nr:hypothetical protein [Chromatiales bacterium]MCP5154181.1 hypothetical protein [Ectothiorhodospiraceae bacterium]
MLARALVASSIGLAAWAQAPTSFNYQAYVESLGAAVDGPADFRFSLWDAPAGGAQVGSTLSRPGLEVVDGQVAAELDFGLSSFDSGAARWLQVEMRVPAGVGAYEALSPRTALNAVPLALHALSGTPGPPGEPGPLAGLLCPTGDLVVSSNGEWVCSDEGGAASLTSRLAVLEAALARLPALQVNANTWTQYQFPTTGEINTECHDLRYARQSSFDPALYVGVILCNSFRYKILLADNPIGPYREIGDRSGTGQDHCELLERPDGTTGVNWVSGIEDRIYYRSSRATPFTLATPPSNAISPPYYECGVGIPVNALDSLDTETWVAYNFPVGSSLHTDCTGTRYVRRSHFDSGLYVGAIRCSASEYKLMLASDPAGPYYEIGDRSGTGQDHCEIVGGPDGTTSAQWTSSLGVNIYYRSSRGQTFTFGLAPSNAITPDSYSCGTLLP